MKYMRLTEPSGLRTALIKPVIEIPKPFAQAAGDGIMWSGQFAAAAGKP